MSDKKELSFSIKIDGASSEATELAKIQLQLVAIKKERSELIKQATAPGHFTSNEERQKLAAYNREIGVQESALKTLKRVIDSASDSLARKKALLIELTEKSNKATAAVAAGMAPAIKKLNDEIKSGEQARGVFTRNVGNYPALFSAMGGPLGDAASKIQNVTSGLGGFAEKLKGVGPTGAIIAGAIMAISAPLVAFFKYTEQGAEMLERKAAGIKAAWGVLAGDIVKSGEAIVKAFEEPDKKVSHFYQTIATLLGGAAWSQTGANMDVASKAAQDYTQGLQDIEDAERAIIVPRAQANFQIKEARLIYNDSTKSLEVRMDALKKSLDLETKVADEEVKNQQWKTLMLRDNNKRLEQAGILRDEDDLKLQQSIAREIELRTESAGRQIKVAKTLEQARKDILAEQKKDDKDALDLVKHNLDAEEKMRKGFFDRWKEMVEQEKKVNSFKSDLRKLLGISDKDLGLQENKSITEQNTKGPKAAADYETSLTKETEDKKLAIKQAALQGAQMGADAAFESKKNRLQAEMEAELSNANLTEQQKIVIQKRYAKEQQRMAISQALINGALAIGKIFAEVTPLNPLSWVAVAMAGVQTAVQVAIIKAQRFAHSGQVRTGVSVPADSNGDNTLILAKTGEVILNEHHQAMLGGAATFKEIGVPGFDTSGIVGQTNPRMPMGSGILNRLNFPGYSGSGFVGQQVPYIPASAMPPASFDMEEFNRIFNARIDRLEVRLDANKVRSALNEVEINNSSNKI